MDACAGPPGRQRRGHSPATTIRVLATLRQFLHEGRPWRGLRATPEHASGSTLRRRLREWAEADNLLQRVHAVLVALLRGHPDLILESCSVRAKRGGLTGPNPTDRGKRGTKVSRRGERGWRARRRRPSSVRPEVHDTVLFERPFLAASAVVTPIRTVVANKGYDAERHRELCRAFGLEPCLHRRGRPHGSGLGRKRWPVERSHAWILENRRLALRYDRLGVIVQSLLRAACLFLVAGRAVQC